MSNCQFYAFREIVGELDASFSARSPTVLKVCPTCGEVSSSLDEISPTHALVSPTLSEVSRYRDTIQWL